MANLPIRYNRPPVAFYGISLNDSIFRTWENDNDESALVINWKDIQTSQDEEINDIYITVAQRFNTDNRDKVKSLAHDIYGSGQIKVNDSVLGIDGDRLEKIGYVFAKEATQEREVTLSIKWVAEVADGQLKEKVITDDAQFQVIKPAKLKKIERQFPAVIAKAYEAMPGHEADYKTFENFRPDEELKKTVEKDFHEFGVTPKEDKGGLITVFYGTNRVALKRENGMNEYGEDMDDQLHRGICEVQLPEGHREGELERPGKILMKIPLPENPHIHIVLKDVQELEKSVFDDDFLKRLKEKPKKQALLFIHGYNTTFKEAAYRAGQLAWDLPFGGYAGFFSWPSAGKMLPYLADEAGARSSVPALKEFIDELASYDELEQLHIIAHSMGSLVLTLSLKELAALPEFAVKMEKIYQVILGAADIDQAEFKGTILPAFNSAGHRRTLYASDHDMALNWSGAGRNFRERLGYVGEEIFVADGLDTVEASNIEVNSSHSYMFKSKAVLSDIYYLLTQGLPPADRRLREIEKKPINYWLFPK
jgi:esterase/lipase superfamily enzyme